MLSAASFLRIPRIVEACESFLTKHLNVSNCLRTLQVANLYELKALLEESYRLASTNFHKVCDQKELLKLRYCELRGIVQRQDLDVPSEVTVFQALVRWIEADQTTRIVYAGRLMCHVRFPLIPESELVDTVESSTYVCQIPEVGEFAREAVRYHLLPHRRSVMQNIRTTPRTTVNIDSIIACGGLALKREGSLTDKMFYCDLRNRKWKPFAQMPEPRHHHAVATMGRFIYVAGGDSTEGCRSPSRKVWRYDTWTEEWLQVANMGTPRESFQLVAMEMKLYAIGGRTTQGVTVSEVEMYSAPNNTWERIQPISSPRRHTAATPLNGRVYVAGGSSDDLVSRRVESYFPVSSKWERRQPLVKPRFSGSLHALDNILWIVGGASVDATDPGMGIYGASEIELYSPVHDQWTILKSEFKIDDSASPALVEKTPQPAWALGRTSSFPDSPMLEDEKDTNPAAGVSVSMTRSEAGSCSYRGKVFLIAGYSWFNRGRIDDVECIDTNCLNKADSIRENYVTMPHREEPTQDVECANKLENYPLRCTGMACATVTLYKEPKFEPAEKKLEICPDSNSHPGQHRIAPKSASPYIRQVQDESSTPTQSSRKSDVNQPNTRERFHQQAKEITNSVVTRGVSAAPRPRGYQEPLQHDRVLQWLNNNDDLPHQSSSELEEQETFDSQDDGDGKFSNNERHSVFLTE